MAIPQGANRFWSLNFVSDALVDSRLYCMPCMIGDFSGECLATVMDISILGIRGLRELDWRAELREVPLYGGQ